MVTDLIPLVQKLTERQNLSAQETERAFRILESDDLDSYFYFVFLAALHTKGETSDELWGFCQANRHFVPAFEVGVDADSVLDVSGTGGDRIKTNNVSTAAAFVVASADIRVVKQAFFAVTGVTGSADLLQTFGVDPLRLAREGPGAVRDVMGQCGMVIYHANSMAAPDSRRGYLKFWLERVPATRLAFVTAYHLASNAYSPIPMRRRVYGVFDGKYLKPLAELFQKLGYTRTLVVHGVDGIDEVSNVGRTQVVEVSDGVAKEYDVVPDDLGLRTASPSDVRASTRENNIADFLRIVYGREQGPKRDIVLANAAAALYVMQKVANLREGVAMAASLIKKGSAADKFENYVRVVGDDAKLQELKVTAGIK